MHLLLRVVPILALIAIGCGKPKETNITGTVKLNGKPLICGYVLLQFDDGNSANGNIGIDGTYSIRSEYSGHAKIAVGSPKPKKFDFEKRGGPPPDPSKIPDPDKWFPIPDKYASPDTSGKDATITGGNNTLDINLE